MVSGWMSKEREVDVMGRTVIEHDFFYFRESTGVGGADFDVSVVVIRGIVVCELTEVFEVAELGEGVEVDVARLRIGRRMG